MTTIRIGEWTRDQLRTIQEREDHSSLDSVVKSLLKERDLAKTVKEDTLHSTPDAVDNFHVVLNTREDKELVSSGSQYSTADRRSEIVTTILLLQCTQCGELQAAEAGFNHVSTEPDRGMGDEKLYASKYDLDCVNCNEEIIAELTASEYPKDAVTIQDLELEKNAKYVPGLENIFPLMTDDT